MFRTTIFDTGSALFNAAQRLFQATAQKDTKSPTAVLIPGGNTPRPLFQRITKQPFSVSSHFHIGYTDERLVPVNNAANNYALSIAMLQALNVPAAQVFQVNTELSLETAATEYHKIWQKFFEEGGIIPLAFLGLGNDGHTCSLFTKEQLRFCANDRFAVPVHRQEGPNRITITPALLSHIKHVVILATGQEKADTVDAMVHKPKKVVAGMALAQCSRVS
ncbi:MAG: 6-phosphogluconolactonase, partial [Candidatus Hydrogenedentes bacterium]|nr:6-phosphogluconolactonase [Candidatus Hydrogenedentota bacterium]